ncbi:MAG: pilus assembly protein [Pseudolabrys sp.]
MLRPIRKLLVTPARRLLRAGSLRRFARAQEGATAVEFGLVAAPFLALLFAILETALVFFAGQALETAAADSGRYIMTGQAQAAGYTSVSDFKSNVLCPMLGTNSLFNCADVQVDVETYTDFSAINTAPPVKDGKLDTADMNYNAGGAGDIVVVRLYYKWPIYLSLLNDSLSNLSGGYRLLVATSVFRNEPFGSNSSSSGS